MAGDLPPSSSVTGVRLRPAASATRRPTRVEPVNIRWSNGSAAKALAISSSMPVTSISVASNLAAITSFSNAESAAPARSA